MPKSRFCLKGDHGWCFNRTSAETHCDCSCHQAQVLKYHPEVKALLEKLRNHLRVPVASNSSTYYENVNTLLAEIEQVLNPSPASRRRRVSKSTAERRT